MRWEVQYKPTYAGRWLYVMWWQMEKIKLNESEYKTMSGYPCIDKLMEGGLEPGIITEFYGEGGAGKSNLAMIYSISALKNGNSAIYIDSEGFSVERFRSIANGDMELINHMNIYRVKSLDDQYLALIKSDKLIGEKRESKNSFGIMVVDSFTNFFRMEAGKDASARMEGYEKQLNILSGIALKYKIPVVITNQIYEDVNNSTLEPFGGFFIDHAMKAIYRIEKFSGGMRRITVEKHRSIREGSYTGFRIVDSGIECEV
ncbi:DNA repair and recombination protein RadB [Ferroplasma acidarmanus Fer1]|uniref:DNA repair and recombination protein RadB n=2 Tax=Ferroplasma TaxID=74968 RepID=S0ATQ8_FERAC|nr:DNA repair and recombination protein RadB [Ferroplasma acidarmanus Fer1]